MCLAFPLHGAERAEPSLLVAARLCRSERDYDANLAQRLWDFFFFFFCNGQFGVVALVDSQRGQALYLPIGHWPLEFNGHCKRERVTLSDRHVLFWVFFWILHLWQRLWRVKSCLISQKKAPGAAGRGRFCWELCLQCKSEGSSQEFVRCSRLGLSRTYYKYIFSNA